MMIKKYDIAILIGRFQPFHQGHADLLIQALAQAEDLIILCGSANRIASERNPWTFKQRKAAIIACTAKCHLQRLHILALDDYLYQPQRWIKQVQQQVLSVTKQLNVVKPNIALIQNRQEPNNYSEDFPQWQQLLLEQNLRINGSIIRELFFKQSSSTALNKQIPIAQIPLLETYQQSATYQRLCDEIAFVSSYTEAWAAAPYPPIFQTVDAVVIQAGHILLIERRAFPGKGLWALPGGFLDPHESLKTACIRELKEETCIDIDTEQLQQAITAQATFDDPYRSARGRTLTQAFLITLPSGAKLPRVQGSDDAAQAFWLPLAQLTAEALFEDHYFVIQHFLNA